MVVSTQNKTTPVDTAIELWGEMHVESHAATIDAPTGEHIGRLHDDA